jgi:ABC-type uncharacterized transport system permease subunit
MKDYFKEILLGAGLSTIFAGILFWVVFNEPQDPLIVGIAILVFLLYIISFIWKSIKRVRDKQVGAPSEDEFTKLASVYAGNFAFRNSMYLWMFIFFIKQSFIKVETMLGIGILGSALIYGIALWYYKSVGDFSEK